MRWFSQTAIESQRGARIGQGVVRLGGRERNFKIMAQRGQSKTRGGRQLGMFGEKPTGPLQRAE